MSNATLNGTDSHVGEAAGIVWHALNDHGPLSFTRLTKLVDAPRDKIMLGVGWLAREDKVTINGSSRSRTVALRN